MATKQEIKNIMEKNIIEKPTELIIDSSIKENIVLEDNFTVEPPNVDIDSSIKENIGLEDNFTVEPPFTGDELIPAFWTIQKNTDGNLIAQCGKRKFSGTTVEFNNKFKQ